MISPKTVSEGSLLTFTVDGDDPDAGQTLTYALEPGAPTGAFINPSSGVFSWIPSEAQGPNNYTITVRVTDNGSPTLSATRSFTAQVNEVNNAPVLSGYTNRTVLEGVLMTATGSASDPDTPAQTLTFSLDPTPPAGVTINPTSGAVSWTPTEAQGPGTYFITVRVTDDGEPALSVTTTMTVIVSEVNAAPVLSGYSNRTIDEGTLMTATGSATDSDSPTQTLTFSLDVPIPAGMTINPTSGAVSWTPTEAQGPGTNSITVRVTDNGQPALSDTTTMTVIVNEVNVAPVLAPIANVTNGVSSTIAFTASATDADEPAQSLSFSLEPGAPAGAAINSAGAFAWTPTGAQAGTTNIITVRVTDDGTPALSHTQSFTAVITRGLRVTGISITSGTVTITWDSTPGGNYRLQRKNSLEDTWSNVGGIINATGTTTSTTDAVGANTRQFYRVEQTN